MGFGNQFFLLSGKLVMKKQKGHNYEEYMGYSSKVVVVTFKASKDIIGEGQGALKKT